MLLDVERKYMLAELCGLGAWPHPTFYAIPQSTSRERNNNFDIDSHTLRSQPHSTMYSRDIQEPSKQPQ